MSDHTPATPLRKARVDARGWWRIGPVRIEPKAGENPSDRKALALRLEKFLNEGDSGKMPEGFRRCPIGLDATPTLCGFAGCTPCKVWREFQTSYKAREIERLERDRALLVEALRRMSAEYQARTWTDPVTGPGHDARALLRELGEAE